MARDFIGPTFGESPGLWLIGEVEFRDLENARRDLAHRPIAPFDTMTADPPIVAA